MTRGHPPFVAIAEAEKKAKARGFTVFRLAPEGALPFDFIIGDGSCVSLVRVRRLKYAGYDVRQIEWSCRNDIAELRSITITQDVFRELWVRGPDRHWYRYLVLPDGIIALEDEPGEVNGKRDGGEGLLSPPCS